MTSITNWPLFNLWELPNQEMQFNVYLQYENILHVANIQQTLTQKPAVYISNTINGIANIEKPVTFICYLRNNHSSIQQSIGQNVTGIAVVN